MCLIKVPRDDFLGDEVAFDRPSDLTAWFLQAARKKYLQRLAIRIPNY